MPNLARSLACLLLLGSAAGCDLESAVGSLPEGLSFRCPCWNSAGLQNTFVFTDESISGVVRRDLLSSAFHTSPGMQDSFRLDLVEMNDAGGWTPLVEIGADADGLYGYACPNQACRRREGEDFVGARFHFTHRLVVEGQRHDEIQILRIEEWDDAVLPGYRFVYDDHPDPSATEAQACPGGDDYNHFATVYEDLDINVNTGNLFTPKFHDTLMFGCQSTGLVKADIFGYGIHSGFDREIHEAAVRVTRADYCGDGQPHTIENNHLHIQDTLGVSPDTIEEDDAFEAIWGADGAICVYDPRVVGLHAGDIVCDGVPIPVCDANDDIETYPDALFLTKTWAAGGVITP